MKKYLFYYHETDWAKVKEHGSFIWYSSILAPDLLAAVMLFEASGGQPEKVIQVIITDNLN